MKRIQKGFTLIELMIVVAIVGILAAVALPAYQGYIKRGTYVEVLAQANPVKTAISECYANENDLTKCDTYAEIGITSPVGTVAFSGAVITTTTAAITVTPKAVKGLATGQTCVLTPTAPSGGTGVLTWAYSGACVTDGLVKEFK
jgi:type IV pilus assembly protein PilA